MGVYVQFWDNKADKVEGKDEAYEGRKTFKTRYEVLRPLTRDVVASNLR